MATLADIVQKVRIVHEMPGAEEAAKKLRDVASAQKEVASSSVSYEKAGAALTSGFEKMTTRITSEMNALRQNETAQRAVSVARQGALDAVTLGSKATAQTITDTSKLASLLVQGLSPAIGIVAKDSVMAAGIVGRELAPALGAVGKQLLPLLATAGGFMAAGAAVLYLAHSASDAVEAFSKFEDQSVTMQNMITATGSAAGRTTTQVFKLVDEIGNINETRTAAQALLSFGSVSTDVFDRALRSANDLSATGFGSITSAARAMGLVLSDPAKGFSALEAAGLRFGARQKDLIIDMVETGRSVEAQRLILELLAGQIGGAGEKRSGTLTGAWTAMSDAMQHSGEQFGQQIASLTSLADKLNTVAHALETINNFGIAEAIAKGIRSLAESTISSGRMTGVGALAIGVSRLLGPSSSTSEGVASTASQAAATAAASETDRRRKESVEAVTLAIEKETAAVYKSGWQLEVDKRIRDAKVSADSQEGKQIALETISMLEQRKAQEDLTEARKTAEANALRAAEAAAKRDLQVRAHLQTAQLEIDLIGKSVLVQSELRANLEARQRIEQDALRTHTSFNNNEYEKEKLINAELARQVQLRAEIQLKSDVKYESDTMFMSSSDQSIASRMRSIYGDDYKAHMNDNIAVQMRFNDALRTTSSLASDFATSFAKDLRNGLTSADALRNSINKLADKLIEMAVQKLVLSAFGALSGSGGLSAIASLFKSADGNVFSGGNIMPFASGGVITSPIIFPMANGAGLAGEAGPEAIVPLKRGADGKLGVSSSGGSGGASVTVAPVVNVTMPSNAKSGDGKAFGNEAAAAIVSIVKDTLLREQRAGGMLRG
ncbi:MAG: phage tail tape measure protein [Rhodoplanes sp.]|nr:phage tail tape measure protein [Rhodoplanes sp.]